MSNDETEYTFKPVNAQAMKALKTLPEWVQVAFIHALDSVYYGVVPGDAHRSFDGHRPRRYRVEDQWSPSLSLCVSQ